MATIDDLLAGAVLPAQDYIVLNGTQSPGRAIVKGSALIAKWEKRNGYGELGASSWYVGEELSEFEVEIALWLPEHFRDWTSFAKTFLSKGPGVRLPILGSKQTVLGASIPKKLKIDHPLLNLPPILIREVVVQGVTQFTIDDYGLYTCTIKFLEHRPPSQIVVAKAKETIPDTPKPAPPTAKTQSELALAAMVKERDELQARLDR